MSKIKVHCPNCSQEYEIPDNYIGKKAECEICNYTFIISLDSKTKVKAQKTKGLINFYKLTDWWFSAFTEAERNLIIHTYRPMGFNSDILTKQDVGGTTQSVISFLSTLSTYFSSSNRYLANRILEKAEELASKDIEISESKSETKIGTEKIKGLIGYYELTDWWLSSLTDAERNLIIKAYRPKGFSPGLLTEQEIGKTTQSLTCFLSDLYFSILGKGGDLSIRIMDKKIELFSKGNPIIDLHLMCHGKIQTNYKDRDIHPKALEKAVDACYSQIAISRKAALAFQKTWGSIPQHLGFKQLCIIREREKKYGEVICLCKRAKEEGWGIAEDWDKRIKRCTEKQIKMQNNS